MKPHPISSSMIFAATVSYLGRVPKLVMARGYKPTFLGRRHQHQRSCLASTSGCRSGVVCFITTDTTAINNRFGLGKCQSSSLRHQRTFTAAAGKDGSDDTVIRRAYDYDDDFFAPVTPKDSTPAKAATMYDEGYGFFDSSDRVFEEPSDDASSAEPVDDDVAAFRARYKRPTAGGSRGEMMPPIMTEHDDDAQEYQKNYNWFEDEPSQSPAKKTTNKDLVEGGTIVRSSARILQPNQPSSSTKVSTSANNIEGGTTVRTSAKILQPPELSPKNDGDAEPKVIKASARIFSKKGDEAQLYQQPLSRRNNYVPSFMEPEKTKSALNNLNDNGERLTPNMAEASNGVSGTSYAATLMHQIDHLKSQIYQLNKGQEFNIDSPKQVSRVLFGEDGRSTNKDALEALASTGNQLAALIYKYRKVTREYKRELKRMEQMEKGGKKNDYYGNLARHRNAGAESSSTPSVDGEAESNNNRREPLLLIDTSAYIFRSYHAIPPLHHSDGTPTGALHGVCRMLQNLLLTRLLKGERPRVVLVFDSKGDNFRHELYPQYKANRGPCPEDLIPQFDLVHDAADAFGIVQVKAEGYEADDVIATLAKRAIEEGVDVDILSGDKDLMQLITPSDQIPSVHMIDPMHFDRVSHDDVIKKWGIPSNKLGDVLALAGDSSDNIPGCPGVGPKIAASLIEEYGSLDSLLEQLDSIKQKKRQESLVENAEKILLYRKLVSLDETIPTDKMTLPFSFESVSNFRMSEFDPNKLIDFYTRLELNACKRQLQNRLRSSWIEYKDPPSPEEYEGVPF